MNSWKGSITGDESWISDYEIELKSQSREWKTQRLAETGKNHGKANQKSKSCCWVLVGGGGCHGIVHHEFAPEGMELCTTN